VQENRAGLPFDISLDLGPLYKRKLAAEMNHEEVEKVAHNRLIRHSVGTYEFRRHAERHTRLSSPRDLRVIKSNSQRRALESYAPKHPAR
jgi:hypothetical protein